MVILVEANDLLYVKILLSGIEKLGLIFISIFNVCAWLGCCLRELFCLHMFVCLFRIILFRFISFFVVHSPCFVFFLFSFFSIFYRPWQAKVNIINKFYLERLLNLNVLLVINNSQGSIYWNPCGSLNTTSSKVS